MLNDCNHTYTWDAYGNSTAVDSVSLTFDALDRMVEQNRSGAYTQLVYSPTGFKMQILNGQTVAKNFVPLAGGGTAVWNTTSFQDIRHPDWLGSSRFASTSSRTMYFDTAYAPFGEPYAQSGTTDFSFTGMNSDTTSGDYDFPFREYSTQGRWMHPDPAGLAAANPSNPQSWNRYSYVLNNPMAVVDPSGLYPNPGTYGGGYVNGAICEYAAMSSVMCDSNGFGMSCVVDGVPSSCGYAFNLLSNGNGAICPNNYCAPGLRLGDGPGGTNIWQQWVPQQVSESTGPNGNPIFSVTIGYWKTIGSISIWDFLMNPVSATVLFPLFPVGPEASGGVGFTVAYNPRTDTGCAGGAVGAMVPAGGRAAAIGPLTVGNLSNADQVLAGGSMFVGAQSSNPAVGVQVQGNGSGILGGATFGTLGVVVGASDSACKADAGKKLLKWMINNLLL